MNWTETVTLYGLPALLLAQRVLEALAARMAHALALQEVEKAAEPPGLTEAQRKARALAGLRSRMPILLVPFAGQLGPCVEDAFDELKYSLPAPAPAAPLPPVPPAVESPKEEVAKP